MYTQCPQCLSVFAIDAATLTHAHGCVSCGHCGAVFDTIATLTDHLPEAPFETLPVNDPAPAPPLLIERVAHAPSPQQALFEGILGEDASAPAAASETHPVRPVAEAVTTDPDMPASFGRPRRAASTHSRWLLAGCSLLAVVLALQLAWAERATPPLRELCQSLGCTLPPIREPAKLELLSRDIRRHPSVADALMISATLRNDARYTQPYPVVVITLSDLDGNRIAMRRFRPTEYLHNDAVRAAGLGAGATTALVFEVHDPGRNAVAFEFGFE
ncbi:MAG TPA: zinc-ribbon and DUF3426 domain-containing protein [Rhodanobacteraceae bacterium]|nr:zinc-ribbon and DUF3426 domain-containing protein [Rhodanobacteraceae bacterium]